VCMALGDHFSASERSAYFERSWEPGRIFYLYCDEKLIKRAKDKYLLLVCDEPNPILFLINKAVNPLIQKDPARRGGDVPIERKDYPCLTREQSFIDCTLTIESFTKAAIKRQVFDDIKRVGDKLKWETVEQVLKKVDASRTLSRYQKILIRKALER